jgi:hypothetical protein
MRPPGILSRIDWYFRTDVSGKPSWFLKMGPIGFTETSVFNYRSTLRHKTEERWFPLHRYGSLKSPR